MNRREWVYKCNHWKNAWPTIKETHFNDEDGLNLYAVLHCVNSSSSFEDIIVGDAGSISYAGPVALKAKENQRFVFSPAQADMGWAVPASIGVSMASKMQVICITGDGSFMSNVQELAVIRKHNLNVKIIVLNNNGYLSIKNTQTKFFDGRVYGTSSDTGLWFPEFDKIAECFDLDFKRFDKFEDLNSSLPGILTQKGPMLIECVCVENQEIHPAQALKNGKQAPLHDMIPFLSEAELKSEMIIDEL
jgi:acetolactate synthase-1/2/3 large subunit